MIKEKVYVIVGRNYLVNAVGCAGVCHTREMAEDYAKTQYLDEYKIFEHEMVDKETLEKAQSLKGEKEHD